MGKLEDQVVIVTGASRGIGQAIAKTFAEEGSVVIVNYLKQKKQAEKVVEQIQKTGGKASPMQADVANQMSVDQMAKKVIDKFGKCDILVNNAGIMYRAKPLIFNDTETEAMWGTNVKGVINCIKAIAPEMIKKRSGNIINISSIAGVGTASSGTTIYAATKAAVDTLTKRFALELGSYGINVNAIAPGLVKTDLILEGIDPSEVGDFIKYCEDASILHRIGEPQDIANVACFLASNESSFMTGQVITVDGGRKDFLSHSL